MLRPAHLLFLAGIAVPIAVVQAEEVTIRHSFGETTVDPDRVQRIVSVGFHEQDFLYALRLAPVGVHEWFGSHPYATGPWAEEARIAVGAAPDVQKGFEIDLEWVWNLQPDLIIATFAPLDDRIYDQLSEIAPVIGPPGQDRMWGGPWEEELTLIAQATGRQEEARQVIDRIEAKLDAAVDTHPELSGLSGTAAYFGDGQITGYRSTDGANRLLARFGIETPAEFNGMAGDTGRFQVSAERFDMFDLDVVLWLTEPSTRAEMEALPSWQNTSAAREGRAIWATPDMQGALSFQSPLSIEWALNPLMQALSAAADGDPGTVTDLP